MRAMQRGLVTITMILTAGCASAEHTSDPTNGETTFKAGSLSGAVTGPISSTQITNSNQVALTGVVADFTRLGVFDPREGAGAASVYFSSRGDSGAPHLWRVNLDGSGLRQLTTDSSGQVFPSISPAGDRLVFRDLALSGGQPTATDLWEWTPSGGPRFLASETGVIGVAGWVPGDTAIVYPVNDTADVGLRQRNLSGGPVAHLTDLPDRHVTTGSINGVPTALFTRRDSIYRIDLTTHDTSLFHAYAFGLLHDFGPDLSPDGKQLLFWEQDVRAFTLFAISTDSADTARQVNVFYDRGRPWRPEAHWAGDTAFVWLEEDAQTTLPQLVLRRIEGPVLHQLTNFPAGVENDFSVGPFVPTRPRALIGEGGELGSSASGIIYGVGREGDLTSVVSFTAESQRSVSLKAETGLNANAPVLTYTLRTDHLLSLAYLADPPDGPAVSVIDSSSAAASGAVISFDAKTGEVVLILTVAANSIQDGVSVIDDGEARVFRGRFTGVWQRGRNLARGSTGEVRLDFRTGSVVIP